MPLFGVHNSNNSCILLSYSPRRNIKERKPVARTQSAPHRRPGHTKHNLKRQTSSEDLTIADHGQEMAINQPHITSPKTVSTKRNYEDSLGYFYLVKKARVHTTALEKHFYCQCFFTLYHNSAALSVEILTSISQK